MNGKRVSILIKSASIAVALAVLLAISAFLVGSAANGSVPEPTPDPTSRGRLSPSTSSLSPGASGTTAPGYCSSNGGSTSYEYINSVTLTPNPGDTMKLTVQIYIANPLDCTAGEPCPEYETYPEEVNAWIDWNGDKTWEASERVMDKALTGYLAINYRGTMTAITQFTPPISASITSEPTWMRANLGWKHDPNDPCEDSWRWGNVYDQQLHLKGPEIKSISAKGVGTPGDNPQTGSTVRLEAELEVPSDYEVTQCSWTGDLTTGNGDKNNKCRYDYTPATGAGPAVNTYGEKNITLTLSYKHTPSGTTGQTSKAHNYKVFFPKGTAAAWSDDDGDGEPNWFEYWGDDGAVAGLNTADVDYDQALGNNTYGYWSPADDHVHFGGGAARTHYPGGLNVPAVANACPGGDFGDVKGIDSAAEVLVHERRHETIYHNWDEGGAWNPNPGDPLADSDDANHPTKHDRPSDDLPDTYETTLGTANNNVDSCDLATHKSATYSTFGDNEFDAMNTSDGSAGTVANDWANPGKQSDPPFTLLDSQSELGIIASVRSGPVGFHAPYNLAFYPAAVDQGSLTGSYSDVGVDDDSDGSSNSLKLSVGVQVDQASLYNLVAWLEDGSSTQIAWASTQGELVTGTQTVDLFFDGTVIRDSELDGPYTIARVEFRESDEEWVVDSATSVHTTGSYQWEDFDAPTVAFTGVYTETLVDADENGLYDYLRINVSVSVQESGTYTVTGELEGSAGGIAVARTIDSLSTMSQTVDLYFDGKTIFYSRQDGPYNLKSLRVEDSGGNRLDFDYDAHSTSSYLHTQFEHAANYFVSDGYNDQGLDLDEDGDYDYLRITLQVNAAYTGTYRVISVLKDSQGEKIADITQDSEISTSGVYTETLDFPGGDIYEHGVDGPYQLASVTFFDAVGMMLDYQPVAHTTETYTYTIFSRPLVSSSTTFTDSGEDTNGNGKYDLLKVDVTVTPGDAGVIVAQARLVDSTGKEIEWVDTNKEMEAGSAQMITLSFDGTLISANQKDGPYEVRDFIVYHTGDPEQSVSISLAHTTEAYKFTDFEGGDFNFYLPLTMR